MRKKYKNTNWQPYFAWHPVVVCNGFMLGSVVWFRKVERRWVEGFNNDLTEIVGFYQYRK